jgi:hypothetical protein
MIKGNKVKEGEINLALKIGHFCGRYSSDTICHTSVLRIEPKHLYVCQGSSNHTYSNSSC